MTIQHWAADCPVSLPGGPPEGRTVEVDFGGFGFTTGGICMPITEAYKQDLISALLTPPFIPQSS